MKTIKILLLIILLFDLSYSYCQPDGGTTRAYGLIPPTAEDLKKIPFAARGSVTIKLPASIDLSSQMPIPGDQGRVQGACVGWAIAHSLVSYKDKLRNNFDSFLDNDPDILKHKTFSPAFIFNTVCYKKQINKCWQGIKFVDALQVLQDDGAVPIGKYPYEKDNVDGCLIAPKNDPEIVKIALSYKLNASGVQVNESSIKEYLFLNQPVLAGITLDPFFDLSGKAAFEKNEKFLWNPSDNAVGPYHAMVIVGYDDNLKEFKIMNSFGRSWGSNGYLFVSYEKLLSRLREAYVLDNFTIPTNTVQVKPSKLSNGIINTNDGYVGALRAETYRDFGSTRVILRFVSDERDVIGVSFKDLNTGQQSAVLLIYTNEEKNIGLGSQNVNFQFINAESANTPNPRVFFSIKFSEGTPIFATTIVEKIAQDDAIRKKNIDDLTVKLSDIQNQLDLYKNDKKE